MAALASCLCLLQETSFHKASLREEQLCEKESSMPEPVGVLAFCQFCLQSSDALLQVGHLQWAALLRSCSNRVHGGLHNQMSDHASNASLHCTNVGAHTFHQEPTQCKQGL